ncbi:MAG: hypothetical protein HY332_06580, partial [Chloroflexi bacterium]|nr:hypothetical protein [Chloroflexota bacterium]
RRGHTPEEGADRRRARLLGPGVRQHRPAHRQHPSPPHHPQREHLPLPAAPATATARGASRTSTSTARSRHGVSPADVSHRRAQERRTRGYRCAAGTSLSLSNARIQALGRNDCAQSNAVTRCARATRAVGCVVTAIAWSHDATNGYRAYEDGMPKPRKGPVWDIPFIVPFRQPSSPISNKIPAHSYGTHPVPHHPTNCTFGDEALQTLYVTDSTGALLRARTDRPGLRRWP